MTAIEANFDGLVGPTHHYAGLSFGNEASLRNQHRVSNPKLAALQGLKKMKALADMGLVQGVIPPHERPHLPMLRRLGFNGSDSQILAAAGRQAPDLLSAVSSASAMWVANAATVCPSADALDGRVHFTVANLNNKFHRAIEPDTTEALLAAIFRQRDYFQIHSALPGVARLGDEGAANHNRLAVNHGDAGLQLFVFGHSEAHPGASPQRYPARQTLAASQAVARLNQVDPLRMLAVQQNPAVIDAGVFHNDVIAVTNRQVLLCHERAFVNPQGLYRLLHERVPGFTLLEVPERQVSVQDAVNSYLFNSQLVSLPDDGMALILPGEAEQHPAVRGWLEGMEAQGGPVSQLHYFDLRESMANGGGPACLRLRVVLTEAELAAVNPAVLMNDALFQRLNDWVNRWYRDRLTVADLVDPQLLEESRGALDELTRLLDLGPVYPFQQEPTWTY